MGAAQSRDVVKSWYRVEGFSDAIETDDAPAALRIVAAHGGPARFDKEDNTALHCAAAFGAASVVAALIGAGAVADVHPSGGTQPIHLAAYNGQVEACAQLIAAGANPAARTIRPHGMTPLDAWRKGGEQADREGGRARPAWEEVIALAEQLKPPLLSYAGVEFRDPAQKMDEVGVSHEGLVSFFSAPEGHPPAEPGPLQLWVVLPPPRAKMCIEVHPDATVGGVAALIKQQYMRDAAEPRVRGARKGGSGHGSDTAAAPTEGCGVAQELVRLFVLFKAQALTQREFADAKAALLHLDHDDGAGNGSR